MGGADHPHVDATRQALAEPPHFSLLQDSQEHPLCGERQVAELVQENRPAARHLEHALALAIGPGEGAARMAEQIGRQERLGGRGTVDGQELQAGPRSAVMDPASHQLLARATLAQH